MERAKISPAISLSAAGTLITIASIWYGQHHGWMPEAASQNAPLVDGLFDLMMTISTWLFLAIQGAIILALIKFRQKPGDNTDGPPIEGNILLELVWTAIPVVIVMVLSVYSFDVYQQMGGLDPMASHEHHAHQHSDAAIAASLDAAPSDPTNTPKQIALGIGAAPTREGQAADVTVDVLGLQYAWLFTYPGGVVAGELHVPAGSDVQLNIAAQDVLHAFWVPQFRLKQDAIPGRVAQLRFRPEKPGTYPIVCAELCGSFHGAMRSQIIVDPPDVYEAWYQSQIASAHDDSHDAREQRIALTDADRLAMHTQEFAITPAAIEHLGHEHTHSIAQTL